jgi:D-serine deaminase-like pyridoxal phosphate-dependent protein
MGHFFLFENMFQNITKPTLLIDVEKVKKNISKMVQKATRHGVKLSPHFKTHQSIKIGEWFKKEGVQSATASSVSMAKYFVDHGWKDVTVVFPLNVQEIDIICRLAEKSRFTVLIDSIDTIRVISDKVDYPIQILLEIDAGYHRTGIDATDFDQIKLILDAIRDNENLFFSGFYCHSGDTYRCNSRTEIEEVHDRTVEALQRLRLEFSAQYPELILSLGDTPACAVTENFEGIDIIRPGNFVFFDLMQVQLGSCSVGDVAIVLACPVVYKNRDRLEITIYGGGVHLSKDEQKEENLSHFGKMVELTETGWSNPVEGCYLKSISQEHGILRVTESTFEKLSIGDVIGILPVHSCMTADLMGEYLSLEGDRIDHMSGPKFRA